MGALDGKVILMTGGARGLGRAMALALVGEGAQVALADIDGEELQATAGEVERIGGHVETLRGIGREQQ